MFFGLFFLAHAAVCVQLKKFGDKELQSTLV